MMNIQDYGNTTAATIPLALDDAIRQGAEEGRPVVLVSVGGIHRRPSLCAGG